MAGRSGQKVGRSIAILYCRAQNSAASVMLNIKCSLMTFQSGMCHLYEVTNCMEVASYLSGCTTVSRVLYDCTVTVLAPTYITGIYFGLSRIEVLFMAGTPD
jgi:hypothetical protein